MFDLAYTLESYDLVPVTEGIKDKITGSKIWQWIIEKIDILRQKIRNFIAKHKKPQVPSNPRQNRLKQAWQKYFQKSKKLTNATNAAAQNPENASRINDVIVELRDASDEVDKAKADCSAEDIEVVAAEIATPVDTILNEMGRYVERYKAVDERTSKTIVAAYSEIMNNKHLHMVFA